MNREQVKEIFKVLAFAYPKFEVTSEKVDFWLKFLEDQNPAVVMKKVERFVMNNPYPPTISELREPLRREDPPVLAQFWKEDMTQ
jgi:hypothetical protein